MTNPDRDTKKILIAVANEAIRMRVIKISRWEFQVIGSVSNGSELLSAAVSLAPNAIVSDICLPQLGGMDVWGELKGRGKDTPFVFLTGERDVSKYLAHVRAAYVHKLDLPTNLNAAIQSTIAGQMYLSDHCRKSRP